MFCARNSNLLRRITTLLIISCLLTVGLCVNTAAALPGLGTQQDPWRIESLADFDEFAADPNYWSGFTRLETDVNLAGRTYSTGVIAPDVNNVYSGFQGTAFTGVFDGNDHKITNLTIDDVGAGNDYLAVFGYIDDGEVRNLGLEGGSVSGNWYVGGLVGGNGDYFHEGGTISNCYSTGDVNGVGSVGGLVGWNYGSVLNSYSTCDVSAAGSYVGGLAGTNWDIISDCYSTGDVSGGGSVGGLVGENGEVGSEPSVPCQGQIINSYSTGDVNGVYYSVGGLVGGNWDIISDCYSSGDVTGSKGVGGLVGENGVPFWSGGYIINSYFTGNVQGASDVGGLVGYFDWGYIEGSFWDVQTSGEPNMCGTGWAIVCDPNCGKTTAEMQTRSTFTEAGWDFVEIWLINEGATYPVLRQEIRSNLNGNAGIDMLDFAIFADHWLEGTDF